MEQTLGNRISENRKRLGLTQDALAEKLGVTAQAVSKWENDQSCPDITTLPKLADIFGISTDALLGRENTQVHTAEVVADTVSEEEEKSGWEFHWDAGRKGSIFFALFVILTGGLTIFARIKNLDVSFWSMLWPSFLLCFGIHKLTKEFSVAGIVSTILGGYFIVANLGIWELSIDSSLIFPGIVVLVGISLLVDALKKPRKPRFRISRNGVKLGSENSDSKTKSHCETDADSFTCNLSFGEDTHYITLPVLESGEINCSFGELTVDLSGCETLAEDCEVEASCSFGSLELRVPKRFRIEPERSTAFGDISILGQPDPIPRGTIRLDVNASFGEIEIRYV